MGQIMVKTDGPGSGRKKLAKFTFRCFFVFILLCFGNGAANCFADEDEPTDKSNKNLFKLDEIVVTGTKTPHQLKDVPVQTIVITDDEIEASSVQSVSDILRKVPGFFVISEDAPGVTSWRSKIRGLDFNSGYGLVLINGQRVKGEGMGEYGYGVNQIPVSMIEKIEIIKGAGSVLYGSDALGGVVNIITKTTPDQTIFGFEAAGGSESTKIASAYAGGKKDEFSVFINGSLNESDIGAYGYRSSRDESYSSERVDSRFDYEMTDQISAALHVAVEDQERTREYKTQDITRYKSYKKYRISPEFKFDIDDDSNAVISGYYYQWKMNSIESGEDSSGFTPTNGDMFYKDIEAKYSTKIKEIHQLTVGAEFLQEKLDYNMARETVDNYSGYFQIESDITDAFSVVLGARADDHSRYGFYFSPKISVMYTPFAETTLRASAGKGFKSPTIRQLYYTELYQHGTYWYQSNPDLDAEQSWSYSMGLEQGIGDMVLFDITLFRNDIEDKVLNVDTGEYEDGLPIVGYQNVSEAYTQGVEVSVQALLTEDLTAQLSYAFTDTEDEDSGNELTYVPTNNVTCGLTYRYAPWGITSSINLQYADEMFTNSDNTKETDDYWLVDAKLSKKFGDHYTLSIEGNNIFDSDYGQPDREWLGSTWLLRCKMDF